VRQGAFVIFVHFIYESDNVFDDVKNGDTFFLWCLFHDADNLLIGRDEETNDAKTDDTGNEIRTPEAKKKAARFPKVLAIRKGFRP